MGAIGNNSHVAETGSLQLTARKFGRSKALPFHTDNIRENDPLAQKVRLVDTSHVPLRPEIHARWRGEGAGNQKAIWFERAKEVPIQLRHLFVIRLINVQAVAAECVKSSRLVSSHASSW